MVDRNKGGFYFNPPEVKEFKVSPDTSVESALETAITFGVVANRLRDQADSILGSIQPLSDDSTKASYLYAQAERLTNFADAIKAKCTSEEISQAELNLGPAAL